MWPRAWSWLHQLSRCCYTHCQAHTTLQHQLPTDTVPPTAALCGTKIKMLRAHRTPYLADVPTEQLIAAVAVPTGRKRCGEKASRQHHCHTVPRCTHASPEPSVSVPTERTAVPKQRPTLYTILCATCSVSPFDCCVQEHTGRCPACSSLAASRPQPTVQAACAAPSCQDHTSAAAALSHMHQPHTLSCSQIQQHPATRLLQDATNSQPPVHPKRHHQPATTAAVHKTAVSHSRY
jgi:hypothetical protein